MRSSGFVLFLLFWRFSDALRVGRDRRCCLYQPQLPTAHCDDPTDCVLVRNNDDDDAKSCRVESDSKAHNTSCDFPFDTSAHYESTVSELVSVKLYSFITGHTATSMPGLDLRFGLANLSIDSIYFRMTNEECEDCIDRCVHIDLDAGLDNELSYDCEIGFFVSRNGGHVVVTSGHLYRLDVCLETKSTDALRCASYSLIMPYVNENDDLNEHLDVALLDLHALSDNEIVLHNVNRDDFDTVVLSHEDNDSVNLQISSDEENGNALRLLLPSSISSGRHRVVLVNSNTSRTLDIAFISISSSTSSLTDVIVYLLVILVLLLLVLGFVVYRQHGRVRRKNVVEPNRLLASGRVGAKTVVIITNVDNRQHVEVVKSFISYLKNHCGVGKVFFALDPETGIASHPEQDPWKWAKQISEELMDKEDTVLVFIGAPTPTGAVSVHPHLPNNQAFVTTHYLAKMVSEKRVVVMHFSYSDMQNIPGVVPLHVRSSSLLIPQDMNAFLCQLLDVRKRELFLCLPIPLVEPKVAPADLSSFDGGVELLNLISRLEAETNLIKRASLTSTRNSCTISNLTFDLPFHLKQPALSPVSEGEKKRLLLNKGNNQRLSVEIEPHVLSLGDDKVASATREVCPEFSFESERKSPDISTDVSKTLTMTTTTTTMA